MKYTICFLTATLLLLFSGSVTNAQVTNLKVNGVTSNFTIIEGNGFNWEYNLPVGGSAVCEVWVDLNQNGIIDPLTDKNLFGTFMQTDGDPSGNHGPPDMDSLVNGHCIVNLPDYNLAPAKYVMKFQHNGVGPTIAGTVTAMPSPLFTVSGKVNVPSGITGKVFLVRAEKEMQGYMTLSDLSGNYTLRFNAAASGKQFPVSVNDELPPYIITPNEISLLINQNYTGINFTFTVPAAKVVGYLKGEDGHVFANVRVRSEPQYNNGGDYRRNSTTDGNGFFQIGYSLSDITQSPIWQLSVEDPGSSGIAPLYLAPQRGSISLHLGDSLRVDLIAYTANDSIKGKITLDGKPPQNMWFELGVGTQDSGYTLTQSNPANGNFTLHVSRRVFNYYVWINDLPDNIGFDDNEFSVLHPGNLNVVLKLQTIAWIPQSSSASSILCAVHALNPSTAWVCGREGTVMFTSNGGAAWTFQTTNTQNQINGIFFLDANTGWFVADGGIIKKTTNGGINWVSQNSTITADLYKVQFLDQNLGFASGGLSGNAFFLKTTNGGTTWLNTNIGSVVNGIIFSFQMLNANTGYIASNGNMYKTTNGGINWNQQNLGGFAALQAVHFYDVNNGYAVGSGNTIYTTHDGGNNWSQFFVMNAGMLNAAFSVSAQKAWVAGSDGAIFLTVDGGNTWTRQLTNRHSTINALYFSDANNGWAVGYDGMILRTTTGGVTDIKQNGQTASATEYSLEQNYPNPFNPSTVIKYRVGSGEALVLLNVYDVLGRRVATLVNEEKPAGNYEVKLDASALSSGVYFYTLQTGSVTLTKKLVVMK